MKIFNLPRAAGKTTRMLYASEFNNIPIICQSETSKQFIMHQAKIFGIKIPEPIVVSSARHLRDLSSKGIKKILIDELLEVAQNVFTTYGVEIIGCTFSDEENSNPQSMKQLPKGLKSKGITDEMIDKMSEDCNGT